MGAIIPGGVFLLNIPTPHAGQRGGVNFMWVSHPQDLMGFFRWRTQMRLQKTEKAREELRGSLRRLGRRERNLLILADGQKTMQELESMLKDEARVLAESLIREGYLTSISLTPPKPTGPAAKREDSEFVSSELPAAPLVSVDLFEGKRSLATTRMFLFDICERMFARRAPEQAQAFRDAFRSARDRESMLLVARDMMEAVEKIAGAERADSISQRIAMLLPVEADGQASAPMQGVAFKQSPMPGAFLSA